MDKQGLSFRGALFLITLGVGISALLPVIVGVQRLTIFWWIGALGFIAAIILRIFLQPLPVYSPFDELP